MYARVLTTVSAVFDVFDKKKRWSVTTWRIFVMEIFVQEDFISDFTRGQNKRNVLNYLSLASGVDTKIRSCRSAVDAPKEDRR